MKVVLTTLGKFHTFDLARQLHARGGLAAIFTGYPRFKLQSEQLPRGLVRTFPFVHAPYMASGWRNRIGVGALRAWELWDRTSLDEHVARRMPQADVFVGLSGCGMASGRRAHALGMSYVCDRGSTHIRHQDEIVAEEHRRFEMPWAGIDPRIVEREEVEYAEADLVTVPSHFVRDTFITRGVPDWKLRVIPYGVDLGRFRPELTPNPSRLDVLFVGGLSLRKGVPYLLEAFRRLRHPRKSLSFAGGDDGQLLAKLGARGLVDGDVRALGHVAQPELTRLMSRSHVLVLPSVEEGLALVMAQAMASGCPVIATPNSGAQDLLDDGVEGFIVPARDPVAIAERLEALATDPALHARMRDACLRRVRSFGGWDTYGDRAWKTYAALRAPAPGAERVACV